LIVCEPCGSSVTGMPIVESTAPCAIGSIDSAPSSASLHVPSAPPMPLRPHAYSEIPASLLMRR